MSDPSNWSPTVGQFPFPPANGTAMSAFTTNGVLGGGTDLDIRWDDPATLNTGPNTPTVRASLTIHVTGSPQILGTAVAVFTVVASPVAAGEYVEVGGIILTAVAGAPGQDEFDGSGDAEEIATSLAACVNNGNVTLLGIASATVSGAVVTLTALVTGSEGDTTSITSFVPQIAVTQGFTGGQDAEVLSIGGQDLVAKSVRTPGGMDFAVGPTVFDTVLSIVAAINDRQNTLSVVTAKGSLDGGDTLVISAALDGAAGNGIPISSNAFGLVLSYTETRGGSGVPCHGQSNTAWTILGVNIYRSDTGERGPYFRLNKIPLGSLFFRDRTNIIKVDAEIVAWNGGWLYRGDAPNQVLWRLKTKYQPVVKATGNAIPASSADDVEVYIDGQRAVVSQVFGPSGEIDLSLSPVWNPSIEGFSYPPVPTEDSVVTISYNYGKGNVLVAGLDNRPKIFYRITSVALDPTGQNPSGMTETPLEYCPPISGFASERLDYIWTEAIRRNRWILEQGGERVKLFLRRFSGIPCNCVWDARLAEYTQQPLNNCLKCFGTGFLGGYEGPIDIIIGPDDSERRVTQTANGRQLMNSQEVWIGPTPSVSQRDFIVKQNGERFSVGPVKRTQIRGVTLQQTFQIGYFPESDIRYAIPMVGLERLAWPETRYTRPEDSPCEEASPYPVGYDYQATPMATEVAKIADGRETRGRTPVYANLTWGGRGG